MHAAQQQQLAIAAWLHSVVYQVGYAACAQPDGLQDVLDKQLIADWHYTNSYFCLAAPASCSQ